MQARVRAYGKEHAFTHTAEKNLEYIANKQRSCHHENDRPPLGGDGPAFTVVEVWPDLTEFERPYLPVLYILLITLHVCC